MSRVFFVFTLIQLNKEPRVNWIKLNKTHGSFVPSSFFLLSRACFRLQLIHASFYSLVINWNEITHGFLCLSLLLLYNGKRERSKRETQRGNQWTVRPRYEMKNVERIERNETEQSGRESTVHSFLFISFLCLIPFIFCAVCFFALFQFTHFASLHL